MLAVAALDVLLRRAEAYGDAARDSGDRHSPWSLADGWRLNDAGHDELFFETGGEEITVTVHYPKPGHYLLGLPGGEVRASGDLDGDGMLDADLDGVRFSAAMVEDGEALTLFVDGRTWRFNRRDPIADADIDIDVAGDVTAPLPGRIAQVVCAAGDKVKKGAALIILEAMKMEHTIVAPSDGEVREIHFQAGDQVEEGAVLVAFEGAE